MAGRVFAVNVPPQVIALLATEVKRRGATDVVGVLGAGAGPWPVASIDLILMVDAHEFDVTPAV